MKWYDVLPACLVDGVKIVSAVLKGSLLATVDMASASAASAHCDADTFQLVDLRCAHIDTRGLLCLHPQRRALR